MKHRRGAGRTRDERGAALVEAAISFLLLIMITNGVIEFGDLYAAKLDTSGAVRSGARAGATTLAEGPGSDYEIIQAALAQAGGRRDAVDRIVIWQANLPLAEVPEACANVTSGPAFSGYNCNVYQSNAFDMTAEQLAALPEAQPWPASERVPGVDYIGVWMSGSRTTLMNLIAAPNRFSDEFVMRIEPATSTFDSVQWGSGSHGGDIGYEGEWYCNFGGEDCDWGSDDDDGDDGGSDDEPDPEPWVPPKGGGSGSSS